LDCDNARTEQGTAVLETSGRLQLKVTRKSYFSLDGLRRDESYSHT